MNSLISSVLDIVRPAQQVVSNLPVKTQAEREARILRINGVEDITSPATKASLAALEAKFAAPSKRTYYLGKCGRVSQRKHLVGELVATVRACNTDQARYLFSQYEAMRSYPVSVPKPYIGEPELCKCGWHHAKRSECPVCANWKHIGESILAGTAEA